MTSSDILKPTIETSLSPSERLVYETMLRAPGETFSMDDIVKVLYKGRMKPKNAFKSAGVIMRNLSMKTALLPHSVVRSSKLGRGRTALYTLSKDRPSINFRITGGRK